MTTYITPEALATELKALERIFKSEILALERVITGNKELMLVRLLEAEKAVNEAKRLMEERMGGFPSMFVQKGEVHADITKMTVKLENLAGQIGDMKSSYVLRNEYTASSDKLIADVRLLVEQMAKSAGRESYAGRQISLWISVIAVAVSVMAMFLLMLRHFQFGG